MNRPLTALFAALEALLVVGIGLGVALVPLTVLWAVQYGLQIDWIVFWRASVDIWLLGNGGDLRITLDHATAASLALPGASATFLLSIAPLGFALLTVLFGVRAGRRIGETPHPVIGAGTALAVFAALALGLTVSALYPLARPSISLGVLVPTLFFAIGITIGLLRRRSARQQAESRMLSLLERIPAQLTEVFAIAFRGGAAAAAALTTVAALAVALLMLVNYAQMIALYESAHAGVLGGAALTIAQIAFLPNLVIWAASWLVGPGFAIGVGSSVSPLGTSLGPIPTIPLLGALPTGDLAFGFLGLLAPVVVAFLVGVILRSRVSRIVAEGQRAGWTLLTGVAIGVVGGAVLGLLAWASSGAAGPGRLVDVGPSPWVVAGFAALEFAVAATLGLFAGGTRTSRTSATPHTAAQP